MRSKPEPFLKEIALQRDQVPSFEQYPFSIPVIRGLHRLVLHPKVTYLIGENGTGKSTLLEAIALAEGFNPEGGSRNFNFSTRDSHSDLGRFLRIVRGIRRLNKSDGFFLRAESLYNVATELDRIGDPGFMARNYGVASLHEQSHGESFLALLLQRFRGDGLYLLDEPESALSPLRQMALLSAMHDLIGRGSQFIIATHSPIVLAYPDAVIYRLSPAGIEAIPYEESQNYRLTKAFLDRREQMLAELMRPMPD